MSSFSEYQSGKPLLPKKGKSIVQAFNATSAGIDLAASALSPEFNSRALRLVASAACHIACGVDSDAATASDFLLPANTPLVGFLPLGVTHLHVIQASAGGNLHVSIASP